MGSVMAISDAYQNLAALARFDAILGPSETLEAGSPDMIGVQREGKEILRLPRTYRTEIQLTSCMFF